MGLARILAIDDEEGVRAFIGRALEPYYEVHFAADGQSGIQQAKILKPDLILLDLWMPGLTGLEVLAKLKAKEATSGIPVVVVSSRGESDALIESQRAGAVDHVIKPFDLHELRRVIQRQLTARG